MKLLKKFKRSLRDDIASLNWHISERKAHVEDKEGLHDEEIAKLIELRQHLQNALQ